MTNVVLSDALPTPQVRSMRIAREITLITGFALFTAALAQVRIPLGFTPVPVTGQTLAVLLAGASLGAWRGAGSQLLYWLLGMVGLPFYSNGTGGWSVATGPTMGYLVGFIVAAAVVGRLAEYRHDRRVLTSIAAMTMGSMIIYAFGAAWLAINLGIPLATGEQNAIALGVTPFLVGDVIKMCLAGLATASTWRFINRA
ncbi:MAG: biotin transporter BioY [Ilumatobacteraceae bacterium]|jgi:biotin transport system substrate-specific component|nr:biotin transporter BioY [Ilumatobacteraceae bacterium]